jgi:hypothetical protein
LWRNSGNLSGFVIGVRAVRMLSHESRSLPKFGNW